MHTSKGTKINKINWSTKCYRKLCIINFEERGFIMRRIISAITMLAFIMVFLSANIFTVFAHNSNTISAVELLSLSDSEMVLFLKEQGVDIPGNPDEEKNWGEFIKSTISYIITNPNGNFLYSDIALIDFANDIKAALIDIGAINASICNLRSNGTLLYSTPIGTWNEQYREYNCYAYALGITNSKPKPGVFSNQNLPESAGSRRTAEIVVDDLEALGYNCIIEYYDDAPESVDLYQTLICVRKDPYDDFHFMKLVGSEWIHKPGISQLLKYNYTPSNDLIWTNEGIIDGEVENGFTTYEDTIYYIAYASNHNLSVSSASVMRHYWICDGCDVTMSTEPHTWVNVSTYYVCSICGYQSSFIPVQPSAMPNSIRVKLFELADNNEENNSIFIENMEFCYIDGQYYYVSEIGETSLPTALLQENGIH